MLTEEGFIEHIVTKLDLYIATSDVDKCKDAAYDAVMSHLSEMERIEYIWYFYKLYHGYTKYKEINVLIDYHKLIESLVYKNTALLGMKGEKDKVEEEAVGAEIGSLTGVSRYESTNLSSFVVKFTISVLTLSSTAYLLLFSFTQLEIDYVLLSIDKFFTK